MLKRTMDSAFLNTVANDPSVRPFLGGDEPTLDLSGLLANPANVALQCEHGGFVAVKLEPGLYECHSMFLPDGRGEIARAAMIEGLRYLFVRTDCIHVVTKCPEGNGAALGAARAMGFVPQFSLERGWKREDGSLGPVDCMGLTFQKWLSRDPEVEAAGAWFHQRLEDLTKAVGKTIPVHFEEPAHNRAAGASVLMLRAGNPSKAQGSYNSWARFAGFPPFQIVNLNPVIIDMGEAVVSVNNDDMEVLLCR